MKAIVAAFTEHPATVGESYGQHFAFASGIGVKLLAAGGAALVHAFLPFLCKTTASRTVQELARTCGPRSTGARR
jgi:hypothetical protein